MDGFKTCYACQKQLPLSRFHRDAREPDGHRTICKTCRMREAKVAKRGGGAPAPASMGAPLFPAAEIAAGAAAGGDAPSDAADAAGDTLRVELPDAAAGEKPATGGLFDRLMDAMKEPAGKRATGKAEEAEQLALADQAALVGGYLLSVAGMVAIPSPYKPCAPLPDHGRAILRPLAEILTEKLDAAGHMSPTTVRLGQSLMAATVYADYAVRTALAIREMNARAGSIIDRHAAGSQPTAAGTGPGGYGAPPPPYARAGFSGAHGTPAAAYGPQGSGASGPVADGGAPDRAAAGASNGQDKAQHAALVGQLLEADALGRRQLGI